METEDAHQPQNEAEPRFLEMSALLSLAIFDVAFGAAGFGYAMGQETLMRFGLWLIPTSFACVLFVFALLRQRRDG